MTQYSELTNPLRIHLKLDRQECVRGESVYFDVEVENGSKTPLANFPDLSPDNQTIKLIADDGQQHFTANQQSLMARTGVYAHEPDTVITQTLAPGRKLEVHGDMLSWMGELPPGRYWITAEYEIGLKHAASPPVPLTVKPAVVQMASTPRYAALGPAAPRSATWVHRKDDAYVLFYQQLAATLPRVVIHGIHGADIEQPPTELFEAVVPDDENRIGHVIWLDASDKLWMSAPHVDLLRVSHGVELEPPFEGRPLHSPVSMNDGGFFYPFATKDGDKVAVVRVAAGGDTIPVELQLGDAKPLGAYCCFWEYDARLHFLWTKVRGREVRVGRLPLEDPASGFTTKSLYDVDEPVIWLDAYVDTDAQFDEKPYFVEQIPPGEEPPPDTPPESKLMLWCVTESGQGLAASRVDSGTGKVESFVSFDSSGLDHVRVIRSVVTHNFELAMLVADGKDQLYYASSSKGDLLPLSRLTGEEITLAHHPGLLTTSRMATVPWVHLRYVKDKNVIAYLRLEPDELDPIERSEQAAKPRHFQRR
ncbi:MAG: hypothetical protein ACYTHJ_07540 [Planctomycetota bacterium]|jgi:hypothetical protein